MATSQPPAQNRWPHRLSYLKYVLVWPLYEAYQQKCARSLRWRLAGSHLATVFLSIIATSIVGALVLVAFSFFDDPRSREPAAEAQEVAEIVQHLNEQGSMSPEDTSAILQGLAEG